MKSPAYWSSAWYEFFMKLIWRQSEPMREQQWQAIVPWIPKGAQVVEVAAGTGRFYRGLLAGHVGDYLAIDINPAFVAYLERQGIPARLSDIRTDPVPPADVVVMVAAFYHFKERGAEMLDKLLNATRNRLIILEPVGQDMRRAGWQNRLRAALVNIGEGPIYNRYRREELEALCRASGALEYGAPLPGNTYLCVLRGRHPRGGNED